MGAPLTRRVARGLVAFAAVLGLLLVVPRAHAGVLADAVGSCDGQVLERPFLPWADPAQYVLAPDGALDSGAAGWQLSGARVVADNEPYGVHDSDAPAALRVGAGGSATTPAMCVSVLHPTLRLLARNAGDPRGTLRVDVLFEDLAGRVQSLTIGAVAGGDEWAPTLPMPVVANLLAVLPGARTPVAFRFTPEGERSAWVIDDVFVDPYCKG
jgi:hypothetical protein